MLLLDPRAGSGAFLEPLERLDVPVRTQRLNSGDAAFAGMGPEGPVAVGIEIKSSAEAVGAVADGRFVSNQLPHMRSDFDVLWLVVYGRVERVAGGEVRVDGRVRGRSWEAWQKWCLTVEVAGGCRVIAHPDRKEAAAWLAALYRWWTRPFASHSSLRQMYSPAPREGSVWEAAWSSRKGVDGNLLRRMAAALPGVGWARSAAIAKAFTPRTFGAALERADEAEWVKVPGVGAAVAKRIVGALRA